MLVICSGKRFSLVLGLVIQYSSGEGPFSGRQSCDHFEFKFWRGGRRGRSSRPPRRGLFQGALRGVGGC